MAPLLRRAGAFGIGSDNRRDLMMNIFADIRALVVDTLTAMMDEGALPAGVAGLVGVPLVGVPTSVGYGVGAGGHAALDAMLTKRADAAQIYDAAAAARTLTLRDRTATAVGRLGVDVVDAPPDKLAAKLADHYLLLKSRGLL